ncbi:MAG: glycosyltransferase family 4 protein [Clostridiales bacterium]|nr:glycosyltransferase family 4 protein [Clostridiales bacterium]MDY4061143.1 glycosyltransferase family 4 protein [Anaerovoracaceae bacterium]
MKVWILNHYAIPPAYGGLNRHYYFSETLKPLGVDTVIFTASKIHNTDINFMRGERGLYKEVEFENTTYEFVKTGEYSGNGIKRIFSFVQFPFNLWRCIKKFYKSSQPDIIYASSPELFSTFVAVLFGKKNKIPTIVEVRDLWPESVVAYSGFTERNLIIKLLYKLERWIYSKADFLIFTFNGGKDYIIKKKWDMEAGGDIDTNKVEYINNGVNIDEFKACKHYYNDAIMNSNKFKIVYTGSVRRVNSISLILEACMELQEHGTDDIDFIIFGDGTEREKLVEKAQEMNLTNIHFRNRVDKKYIPSILNRADATIIVGQHDTMSMYGISANKIFDYMAAGKPIISNLDVGYDEIIKHNCGIVIPGGTGKDIAEAALKLRDLNIEEYNLLCENAEIAAKEFDYKKLSMELFSIYKKIKTK